MTDEDVLVAGGGVAGLSAALFTARAGLPTRIVSTGESILNRNAHLDNFPGFPAGINPRLLLELMRTQARENGAEFADAEIERLEKDANGFVAHLADGDETRATYVIAASWSDPAYLSGLDVNLVDRGSKQFVGTDDAGRTDVEGLYAAGRLAERHHQTIVAAGHGAQVALTLLEDAEIPFYHDWTAPEGYFTGRGRDVPPGCEEISEEERQRRERESLDVMSRYFEEPTPGEPTMHPSVDDE